MMSECVGHVFDPVDVEAAEHVADRWPGVAWHAACRLCGQLVDVAALAEAGALR